MADEKKAHPAPDTKPEPKAPPAPDTKPEPKAAPAPSPAARLGKPNAKVVHGTLIHAGGTSKPGDLIILSDVDLKMLVPQGIVEAL